jgi:glycosyltransferase involved in cell wall biosynthesis
MMETKVFFMTSNYYPPYHVGGACVHVHQLANALAELGHEVHVVYSLDWYYFKKGNVEPKDEYPNNENVILHPIRSSLGSITPVLAWTFGYYYPLSGKILKIINNVKPDVIHHHNITGFGPFVLKAKAERVIYTAHDYWLVCPTYSLLKNNKKPCINPNNCSICSILSKKPPQVWRGIINNQKLTENIDTIISPSDFLKNELIRFGVSKKIEVIPNFVEVDKTEKPRYFRDPYLLYVGRLEYSKGIINLIESYFEVLKKIENHLIIVGDGSLKEKIKAMVSSKKAQGKIHYLGQVDNSILSNLYQYATAVVIPSIWHENCPLVALEAISYGTPIIAANTGGLSEIVNNSKAGVLVNMEHDNSLSTAIVKTVDDEIYLKEMRYNANINSNFYLKSNYLKQYLNLIEHKNTEKQYASN